MPWRGGVDGVYVPVGELSGWGLCVCGRLYREEGVQGVDVVGVCVVEGWGLGCVSGRGASPWTRSGRLNRLSESPIRNARRGLPEECVGRDRGV